jgi:hypothetical protein
LTDLQAKQIDKICKSKAAQSYRVELVKAMDAEALKRGEAVNEAVSKAAMVAAANGDDNNTNLLDNLSLAEQDSQDAFAQHKLAAARAANSGPAQSKAAQHERKTRDSAQ